MVLAGKDSGLYTSAFWSGCSFLTTVFVTKSGSTNATEKKNSGNPNVLSINNKV